MKNIQNLVENVEKLYSTQCDRITFKKLMEKLLDKQSRTHSKGIHVVFKLHERYFENEFEYQLDFVRHLDELLNLGEYYEDKKSKNLDHVTPDNIWGTLTSSGITESEIEVINLGVLLKVFVRTKLDAKFVRSENNFWFTEYFDKYLSIHRELKENMPFGKQYLLDKYIFGKETQILSFDEIFNDLDFGS